jgi:hypothetical protein
MWYDWRDSAEYKVMSITIPKSRKLEFENRLMDHQRAHNRGQFGVSVILGATSEDLAGNITYFSLPDQVVVPILKSSGIPYRVN